jgi:CRISPR-associated endonuclease Cas2
MTARLSLMVYDVVSDRRRAKLHALLSQYGVAVQKCAFEGRLTIGDRRRLVRRVLDVIDAREDRFTLYVLDAVREQEVVHFGPARPAVPEERWIVL